MGNSQSTGSALPEVPETTPPLTATNSNPAGHLLERLQEAEAKTKLYHALREEGRKPPLELGIPLRTAGAEIWNEYFEDALLAKYGEDGDAMGYTGETMGFWEWSYAANLPLARRDADEVLMRLTSLQACLVPRAEAMVKEGTFKRAWLIMSREERKEMVLEALLRAADVVGERARLDCPEMSLWALIGDSNGIAVVCSVPQDKQTPVQGKPLCFPERQV
ncbi:hypothetical protein C8F01DRAFT_1267559 [Mycena amicta]|nr:hypothetical protein C8F01DRAFT_1267559 [Mycena amicta]